MLNILQTEIAFADWLMENVLNKTATRIAKNGDKETCLKLEHAEHDVHYERHEQVLCWYLQKEEYKDSLYEHGICC